MRRGAIIAWPDLTQAARSDRATRSPTAALALALLPALLSLGAAPAGVGIACDDDRGCPGYLRCQESHCAVPPAVTGLAVRGTGRVVFSPAPGREVAVSVEVVDEEWERARGLMFRDRLAPGWGMLFVYPAERRHSFWMRNTLVPLDLVFLGPDGLVRGVVEHMRPLDDAGRGIERPSRDVLEIAAGAARRAGIREGTPYRTVDVVRPAAAAH